MSIVRRTTASRGRASVEGASAGQFEKLLFPWVQ
jgi:hypothetical protein